MTPACLVTRTAICHLIVAASLAFAQPAIHTIKIGTPIPASRVPAALRQGVSLPPQSVSALDVSEDSRFIAVTTMAFRNDRNFWLMSRDGKLLWGRYVLPWAPVQTSVLPEVSALGAGLAYSRITPPYPTISLFSGEKSEETVAVDSGGQTGWLRYGTGDWRTG